MPAFRGQSQRPLSEQIRVAAVCGREMRVYGPMGANSLGQDRRPLLWTAVHNNHGQALAAAVVFDDAELTTAQRRGSV